MNEANERRTNSKQHKMECICKVDENCKWMKVLTVWIRVFVACFFSDLLWICIWCCFKIGLRLHFISFVVVDDETVAITWFCCARNIVCLLKWTFYKRCPFPIQQHSVNWTHKHNRQRNTKIYQKPRQPNRINEMNSYIYSINKRKLQLWIAKGQKACCSSTLKQSADSWFQHNRLNR